ncbi:hypothetical protein ACE3MZ_04805 [Paenibacillus sp. WLX1005]|uniref:hypothetical protein n=1 Tax=Paenibacillus sp. WLX1005 TaxID=3243766 RepID=UPI0039842E17
MGLLNKQNGLLLAGTLLVGTWFSGGTASALSYSSDVVPTLTSNTGSNGAASASVEESGHEAWRAFDDTVTADSYWRAPAGDTSRISYQFNDKRTITKYTVQAATYDTDTAPKDWVFAGKIGNNWLEIDQQSGEKNWKPGERRTFEVDNDVAYSGYALFISNNNGGDWVAVDDLELTQFENNYNLVPPTPAPATGKASASVNAENAWKAFDHSTAGDSSWVSDSQRYVDASLSYTFDHPTVVKGYSLTVNTKSNAPTSWILVGSNDGEQWEEAVHEVPSAMRWEAGVAKAYAVDNTKAYKTYKLIISRNSGPAQVSISELELY